jgi:hypothetical protein
MFKIDDPALVIPEPARIRSRLSDLATEANFLRALLRLLEKTRSGQHLLRRRSESGKRGAP